MALTIDTFCIRKEVNHTTVELYPSVVRKDQQTFLIDCGYEETFTDFIAALDNIGITGAMLSGIILSHDDIDHLGGLHLFKSNYPAIRILCSDVEAASVSGRVKSERLIQAEESFDSLPSEYQPWAEGFIRSLKNIQRHEADKTFSDGDLLLDELRVIHTPGHTKGHVSFYHQPTKTLIACDAVVIENDRFEIANPSFTLDMKSALDSVIKIRNLDPVKIICYHGGIMQGNVAEKLDELVFRYRSR